MTPRRRFGFLAALLLGVATACGGDGDGSTGPEGPSSGLVPISWTRAEHQCPGPAILTVTELFGPRGARIGNIIPGTYLARGRYNLTGTSLTGGEISLGFLGRIITGLDGTMAEERTFIVPSGELTGTYEVVQGILELAEGPGNPVVDFVIGNTVHDCLALF